MKQTQLCTFPTNFTNNQNYTLKDYKRIAVGSNKTNKNYYIVYQLKIQNMYLTVDFDVNQNGIMSIVKFYFIEQRDRI